MGKSRREGFTLIELMMTVAIIGLLAAIAIPKFGDMIIRAREAAVRGHMGSIRSAISIYYSDNEGVYPGMVDYSLTVGGRYLNEFPMIALPHLGHVLANVHSNLFPVPDWPTIVMGGTFIHSWWYSSLSGELHVSCTHADSRGTIWSRQ